MSTNTWRTIDRLLYRITVEERADGVHLATFWDKTSCDKNDREVYEFETWGGACDRALELLDDMTQLSGEAS